MWRPARGSRVTLHYINRMSWLYSMKRSCSVLCLLSLSSLSSFIFSSDSGEDRYTLYWCCPSQEQSRTNRYTRVCITQYVSGYNDVNEADQRTPLLALLWPAVRVHYTHVTLPTRLIACAAKTLTCVLRLIIVVLQFDRRRRRVMGHNSSSFCMTKALNVQVWLIIMIISW